MAYALILCMLLLVAVTQIEMLPLELAAESRKTGLFRVKRTVIGSGNSGCSEGMVRLWRRGPCVTCEEYMEHKDTDDCPTNNG